MARRPQIGQIQTKKQARQQLQEQRRAARASAAARVKSQEQEERIRAGNIASNQARGIDQTQLRRDVKPAAPPAPTGPRGVAPGIAAGVPEVVSPAGARLTPTVGEGIATVPGVVTPPRQKPTVATPEEPIITRGELPTGAPGVSPEQMREDIAIKRARGEELTEDDLRFEFRDTRRAAAPSVTGAFTAEEFLAATPEQQREFRQQAFEEQARRSRQLLTEGFAPAEAAAQAQRERVEQRIAGIEEGVSPEQQEELARLQEDLQAQEQRIAQNLEQNAEVRREQINEALSFQGFARSTKRADLLNQVDQELQTSIADIQRQTRSMLGDAKVNFLAQNQTRIASLQDKLDTAFDRESQVSLGKAQAQMNLAQDLFAADPSNPDNVIRAAENLAKTRLETQKLDAETQKLLREDAVNMFDNAIKYGYIPEALTSEQADNISSVLGISKEQIADVIESSIVKANTEAAAGNIKYFTDEDGNVTAAVIDPTTGQFNFQSLGGIGASKQTRFQAVTDPLTGLSRVFDPTTGLFVDGGGGGTGRPGFNLPQVPGQPGKVLVSATTGNTPKNLRENCVFFARSVVPGLPTGLVTSAQKRNMVNSKQPEAGAVAMMPTFGNPKIGHVAVVESVNDDGTVTVVEANVRKDQNGQKMITRRTGTPQDLKIEGYWSPTVGGVDTGAKSGNYTTPEKGKGETINGKQKYTLDPNSFEFGFERALAKGGNVDADSARLEFLTTVDPAGTNRIEALQEFSRRFSDAQSAGLDRKYQASTQNQLFGQNKDLQKESRVLEQGFAVVDGFDVNHDNPFDDQALIFSFMKVLDPGSVVREGEFKTAQNNASLLDSLAGGWRKSVEGTGMITSAQRRNILNTMQTLHLSKRKLFNEELDAAAQRARDLGIDPSLVLFRPEAEPERAPIVGAAGTGRVDVTPRVGAEDILTEFGITF